MKRIKLIMILIVMGMMAAAAPKLQIQMVYENGIYDGHTYESILVLEEDFLKDRARYEGRFFEELDKQYNGIAVITDSPDAELPVLRVEIIKVDHKGNLKAEVTYGDHTGIFGGKGGVFGTWLNLFGDGMQSLGKVLGAWVNNVDKMK